MPNQTICFGAFGSVRAKAALKRGGKFVAAAHDPKSLTNPIARHGDGLRAKPPADRNAVPKTVAQIHRHFGRFGVILKCRAWQMQIELRPWTTYRQELARWL
jgi:hypothetical protein